MDNTPNDTDAAAKKEQLMRTLRMLWMILIAVFAAVILFRLYSWSQGKGGLHEIASPLGMIFIGLATIIGSRNKPLYYVLIAVAMILVVSGLIMTIMY